MGHALQAHRFKYGSGTASVATVPCTLIVRQSSATGCAEHHLLWWCARHIHLLCRSSRSHAIFTISLEQRRRQMMRPASAPPSMGCTPGGNNDSSDSDSSESEEEPDDAGDEYLIAKVWHM